MALLGIDLGTTGCKAAVYDEAGVCLGESYLEYGLITLSPLMIEQDPLAWWALTCQAVREALAAAQATRDTVKGVSVSSQGISFVLVDEAGQPLGNALNWLDGRALEESAEILAHYPAERLFALTGKRAAPFYVLPKLLWLRKHKSEDWHAARRVLMGHDYLVYRMCGTQLTDHSLAGGTLLYDLHAQDWSDELLGVFGISRSLLPDLVWSGTPAGELLPEVADELELSPHTPVYVGGQDQKCAALGAGIADGIATVSLGTAAAIIQVMNAPATDPGLRIPTFPFVQPNRWALEGVIATGAGSLRWYRDTLSPGVAYPVLDEEANRVALGSDGVAFYPHLGGAGSPRWQSLARGTFHGLSLASSRGHLTRAVLEGVAYQIRENLAVTQELAGPVDEVILFGGGAKSALWREIICNVIDRPVVWTPTVETAGLGAAMLAGLGSGVFASLAEARQSIVRVAARREPDPEFAALYTGYYEKYLEVENRLLEGEAA